MPEKPRFDLSIHSFTPPALPDIPADSPASSFRSPLIPSPAAAISALSFTVSLPSARDDDPLYPASHLQVAYNFEGTGEVFFPDFITSRDLVKLSSEAEREKLYSVHLPANQVQPRTKVNEGETSTAEVCVYAWRGEKFLGKWSVGRIDDLGIVGLKSHPLAILRRDTWAAQRATN